MIQYNWWLIMQINYNDTLQKRMLIWKYYDINMNPFYSCLASYLIETLGYELHKHESKNEQIKRIVKKDSEIFKKILKIMIKNDFLKDLSFRYEYNNAFYKNRKDENHFSILKFAVY